MFKDTCRKGKTIKSTEITVTKANVDMITDVNVGCCDEGSTGGLGGESALFHPLTWWRLYKYLLSI